MNSSEIFRQLAWKLSSTNCHWLLKLWLLQVKLCINNPKIKKRNIFSISPSLITVCKKIVGRLSSAISQQEDVSVQLEALDILGDLLSRFGGLLIQFHPSLLEALSPQLKSPRLAVRKRSIIALGHLVMSCDQILYLKLINMLLDELNKGQGAQNTRTYIQAIGEYN